MSKKKNGERKVLRDLLTGIHERLSKMEGNMSQFEASTNERLTSIEETIRRVVSPPRRPTQKAFESLGGLTTVTPAMELTLEAVKGLTEDTKQWVTVEEIAIKTGRSLSTESAYTKTLSKVGAIARKPTYKGTGDDRRVRKYIYRSKK